MPLTPYTAFLTTQFPAFYSAEFLNKHPANLTFRLQTLLTEASQELLVSPQKTSSL